MPLEVCTQRNFVADFIRLKLILFRKTEKIPFYPPFRGLRGNVRTPSIARWKVRCEFLFVIIEPFRYLLRLRCYKRKSLKSAFFEGDGSLSANTSIPFWSENTGDIPVSDGVEIQLLFRFVTIHASDIQTDRQTDGRTELRQQYRALHYVQSHSKNC